ncbi:ATP-grasp domain-containing protein [Micromonospora sp. LOL_023]|uniref:ATP-grasp domain-containing protein n=1 Tax=Micromonospora sp. LOL_023 TaxID=3345418 RepID=UPI003A862268
MTTRLAWVSARDARGRDADEPLAVPALQRAGIAVDVVVWDDPAVRWADYDRTVVRSTWDYAQRLGQFLTWLETVEQVTDLRNPSPMLRWNLDKRYLADLDRAGVPVTETTFMEPGDRPHFPVGDFVVKPAVGAGSRGVASYGPTQHDMARVHVRRLQKAGVSVLVQPLLSSVAIDGEWPLVFFAGRYSHAANKRVVLPRAGTIDDLFADETNAPHVADAEQIVVAQKAVDVVAARFGVPLYARVDLVRDDQGLPRVLELELVEPSLFLPQASADALGHFVAALGAG